MIRQCSANRDGIQAPQASRQPWVRDGFSPEQAGPDHGRQKASHAFVAEYFSDTLAAVPLSHAYGFASIFLPSVTRGWPLGYLVVNDDTNSS